jgi:hypothetical protein
MNTMLDATPTAPNAAVIQTILEKAYGADEEGFYPMNQKLSEQIEKVLRESGPDNIERKVTNLIWNNYAGGDLAAAVANEIIEEFGYCD